MVSDLLDFLNLFCAVTVQCAACVLTFNVALCVVSVCLLSDVKSQSYGEQKFAANYTSTEPTTIQECLNICDEKDE